MPTAANLNLYRGWKSCVGWHCDDEPLFGKYGDAKLIVSVSLGNFALFRWRRQSCPWLMKVARAGLTMVTFLLWMGNARTSSFIGRTLAGNRIGLTLRSVGSNRMFLLVLCLKAGVACCLPTFAQGSSVPVMGNTVNCVFWAFWVSSWCLVHVGSSGLSGVTVVHKTWVTSGVPPAGHALWAEVGREHYLCNLWGGILKSS